MFPLKASLLVLRRSWWGKRQYHHRQCVVLLLRCSSNYCHRDSIHKDEGSRRLFSVRIVTQPKNVLRQHGASTDGATITTTANNNRMMLGLKKQTLHGPCYDNHFFMMRNTLSTASAITFSTMARQNSSSDDEVYKFSQMSKIWWNPKQNPLIGMNVIRVPYIVNQMIQKSVPQKDKDGGNHPNDTDTTVSTNLPLQGLKALDVGCGGGLLSESLARLGADVIGIDPSFALIEQAKLHAQLDPKTSSIQYRGGCTVEELAEEMRQKSTSSSSGEEDDLFDIICVLEVIEHVTDVPSIFHAVQSLLKPNTGRLFVSTLNRTFKSKVVAIYGAEYIMRYLPPGTHDWHRFRSPQEVQQLVAPCKLQQVDVQGMKLINLPFLGNTWNWKLDPNDVDVNWIGTYSKTLSE